MATTPTVRRQTASTASPPPRSRPTHSPPYGQTALLYLTPTGLDGELASQYYPVGVTAGVYVLDGDVAALSADNDSAVTFSHTVTDTGDSIPNVLSLEEAKDSL